MASGSPDDTGDAVEGVISATIKYPQYDGMAPTYCNNMVVQTTPDGFVLSFYTVLPPVLVISPEERQAHMKGITEVPATCVGKILVPPSQIDKFAEALKSAFERSRARQGEKE